MALAGVVVGTVTYTVTASPDSVLSSDWTSFATGAHLLRSNAHALYDHMAQREVESPMIGGGAFSLPGQHGLLPYFSPPWVAMLALPFTFLGDVTGGRVWSLVQLVCLAIGIAMLTSPRRRLVALPALASFPTVSMVLNGQLDGLVVVGLGAWWALVRHNRHTLAGLALTLTLVKPQLVLVLALFILCERRWREGLGWLGGAAVLILATSLVDGAWLVQALSHAAPTGNNLGIPGIVSDQGHGPILGAYLVSGVTAGFTLLAAFGVANERTRVAIVIAGGLLSAPHALATDFILLAAAILIVGDGGIVVWAVLSAGSLVCALMPYPLAVAVLSSALITAFLARFAGEAGRLPLPDWWRAPAEHQVRAT